MALPASGAITQLQINSEFGAPYDTPLTEMVRGGDYVTTGIGPNASIPAAPPISLQHFYGTEANPPGVLENFTIGQGSSPTIKVLSMGGAGLYVYPYDGVNLGPSQFVVDTRVRLMPGYVEGVSAGEGLPGGMIPIRRHRMSLIIGLTATNPVGASQSALVSGITCARQISFYRTTAFSLGAGTPSHYFVKSGAYPGSSYQYAAGSSYQSLVMPSDSVYTHIRMRRGVVDVGGKLRWDVLFYYNNFLAFWGSVADLSGASLAMHNAGGYLFMANSTSGTYEQGSGNLSVQFVKFVNNTTTPPW